MTFVVAEIGVNWDGDFQLAKKMVEESKKAGCDAVKFQAFQFEQIKSHPEAERLIKASISKENIEKINQIANENEIDWFCTPMYPEIVELLKPYVKMFKLRELDGRLIIENKSNELIKNVLETGKEIFVSTEKTPKNCKDYGNSKIKWLYCVPKYPCNIEDIDFGNLKDFNGYSNHCIDPIVPISAAVLGADVIEIHVTMDKNGNYIDNNVSFDFNELKKMVSDIRKIEKIKL